MTAPTDVDVRAIARIALEQLSSTNVDGLALVMARGMIAYFPSGSATPPPTADNPWAARINCAQSVTLNRMFSRTEINNLRLRRLMKAGEKIARILLNNAYTIIEAQQSASTST